MWPMSRKSNPKHFLPLIGKKSLFVLNYEALRKRFKPSEIYIQTNELQARIARAQVPEIPKKNYFIEPDTKNQGPAMGFAMAKLFKFAPDEPFIIVQADVVREPSLSFIEMINEVEKIIRQKKKLVTGGFRSEKAIMGVDYLIRSKESVGMGKVTLYKMEKWLGRDSKEKVNKYVSEGRAYLHANHYAWTPRLMLNAYKKHMPAWHDPLSKIINSIGSANEDKIIKKEYSKMPEGPAEKVTTNELQNGYIAELNFKWTDFGTWESVDDYIENKKGLNDKKSVFSIDCKNNYIISQKNKFVATIGVDDLVVIDTADALLVCKKDQSGNVGEIVKHLKKNKKHKLI